MLSQEPIATDKELISFLEIEIRKMSREITTRDRIIADYERQIPNLVEHIFQQGKEIDNWTEYAFDSPFMNRREHKS